MRTPKSMHVPQFPTEDDRIKAEQFDVHKALEKAIRVRDIQQTIDAVKEYIKKKGEW